MYLKKCLIEIIGVVGVINKVPNRFSKDGNVRTEVEKLTNGKGSTLTVMENGIRSFKFVYDVDGTHLKTIFYDGKGLKSKEIEVR